MSDDRATRPDPLAADPAGIAAGFSLATVEAIAGMPGPERLPE